MGLVSVWLGFSSLARFFSVWLGFLGLVFRFQAYETGT